MNITVDWTELKTFADSRSISVQFVEFDNRYTLSAFDGTFSLVSNLFKVTPRSADQVDFEDNYKARGNLSDVQMNWFQRMSTQGNVYATGTSFTTILSGEIPLLRLTNSSTSKRLHIFRASLSTDSVQVLSTFRIYSSPTITTPGTQVPIVNQLQGSIKASQMSAYQTPTISSLGNFITSRTVPPGAPTQNFELPSLYTLEPGQEVLITVSNSILGVKSQAVILWVEM